MAKNEKSRLWSGVVEADFLNERNIEPVDIAEFNDERMKIYSINVNLWRHLPRLLDSLKPVERRLLYAFYLEKGMPGKKLKCPAVTGTASKYHPHGECYSSLVEMTEHWKKQVPLITGKGNFASPAHSMYAAARYTEASMSQYAAECFFSDYDEDCVETVLNTACNLPEPVTLPSKFPDILVNGGLGITIANAYRTPPFNIDDIIDRVKKVIEYPETANVFMIPDFPCGCEVVDDGHSFQDLITTGVANITTRASAEIMEYGKNAWAIRFTSIPWMSSLESLDKNVRELTKSGVLPIRDVVNKSSAIVMKDGTITTEIDYRVIFDKAHDPYVVLDKLYKSAKFASSDAYDIKVTDDNNNILRMNVRELIKAWIDERRSYKRRLFNKRLTKISARIELLNILIILCTGSNVNKTIKIIRESKEDEAIRRLMQLATMTSYQAAQIYETKLRAFNADAKKRYEEEVRKLVKERDELMKLVRSEKRIDRLIMDELEDLRKYAHPRRSKIIAAENGKRISDTMHTIVITQQGLIKKLPYNKDRPDRNINMGAFRSGDYPVDQLVVHNSSSVTFLDTFGRYSIIPVHEIDNTEPTQFGNNLYTVSKLKGNVVQCMESFDTDIIKTLTKKVGVPYLVTISQRGYAKKTPMEVYLGMKNSKDIRAMKIRDDDALAIGSVMFDNSRIVIYTNRGEYAYLKVADIAEQSKDSMGLITLRVEGDDFVRGYAPIAEDDDYVLIISDKGMVKKIAIQYFGDLGRRGNSSDQGSLMTLDSTDGIRFASGMKRGQKVTIALRNLVVHLDDSQIPDMTKKAKGKKLLSPTPTANIVAVQIHD